MCEWDRHGTCIGHGTRTRWEWDGDGRAGGDSGKRVMRDLTNQDMHLQRVCNLPSEYDFLRIPT